MVGFVGRYMGGHVVRRTPSVTHSYPETFLSRADDTPDEGGEGRPETRSLGIPSPFSSVTRDRVVSRRL